MNKADFISKLAVEMNISQQQSPNHASVLPSNRGGVKRQSEKAAVREPCQI